MHLCHCWTVEGQLVGTGSSLLSPCGFWGGTSQTLGSASTGTALQTPNLYLLADRDLLSWVLWLTIGKGAVRALKGEFW